MSVNRLSLLLFEWSLFVWTTISEFDCQNRRCCVPKVANNNQHHSSFATNCNVLNLQDCISNNDICEWDCTPQHTQQRHSVLSNAGYTKKTFKGIVKGNGQYLDPSFVGHDRPVPSHWEPTTVDEVIEFNKIVSVDDCGIEYEYELDRNAAEKELIQLKQKENLRKQQTNRGRNEHEDHSRDAHHSRDSIAVDDDVNDIGAESEQQHSLNERDQIITDKIRRLTIFGADTRTQVTSISDMPFSGYLQFETADGVQKRCSASLIAPNWIITAAHCVHNGRGPIVGEWYSQWTFYPGLVSVDQMESLKVSALQAWTFGQWTNGGVSLNFNYDIAWIELDVIDTGIPYLELGSGDDISSGDSFNIVGYPGDQPWLTRWHQYCSWQIVADHTMYSADCDITGGSSGSPVYSLSTDGASTILSREVVCIVSWENNFFNGCARITQSKLLSICSSIGICDDKSST